MTADQCFTFHTANHLIPSSSAPCSPFFLSKTSLHLPFNKLSRLTIKSQVYPCLFKGETNRGVIPALLVHLFSPLLYSAHRWRKRESCDDIQKGFSRYRSLWIPAGASLSISGPWCTSDGSLLTLAVLAVEEETLTPLWKVKVWYWFRGTRLPLEHTADFKVPFSILLGGRNVTTRILSPLMFLHD